MKWPEELNFMKNSKAVQKETSVSLEGKWAVVSGATSGVGLATLHELAKAKCNLVMVCRNVEKAKPIQAQLQASFGVKVDIIKANFEVLSEVKDAADIIIKTYPTIDILINSVGIHSTKKYYTKERYELCLMVNHLSVFYFTKLLLPTLKSSAPARILQVNSEGHRFSKVHLKDLHFKRRIYTGLKGYGQSKTAQLLTVLELADELKDSGVTINAVHPGAVKTAIGSNNGPLYRCFFKHVTSKFLKDPVISGKALYYLAADPELDQVSGRFFNLTIDEIPAKHARDRVMSKLVYDLSLDLVGLSHENN